MRIVGIVCEYNPLHLGHEYQIEKSRELLGEDTIVVCVMSGDFVQRGEAAVFSKYARAEAACLCGADLVVELPLPWVLSSAEGFARGAVSILHRLGANYLSFGSEAGETEQLEKIAECILTHDFQDDVKAVLNENANISYASAREKVLEKRMGEVSSLIKEPNNILAVEYIKAIRELNADIKPVTVKRIGSAHDSIGNADGPRSASDIRRMIEAGEDYSAFVPAAANNIYIEETAKGRIVDRDRIETAILSRLRMFSEQYFENLRDGDSGVGRRLYKAIQEESTLDKIAESAKTKRYAYSRIKRLCMNAALGISKEAAEGLPEYTRVLAMTERGREVLRNANDSSLSIVTKPASVKQRSTQIKDTFENGANAHDLFVLAYKAEEARKCGEDWKISPKIVHFT